MEINFPLPERYNNAADRQKILKSMNERKKELLKLLGLSPDEELAIDINPQFDKNPIFRLTLKCAFSIIVVLNMYRPDIQKLIQESLPKSI